ncbi:DUF676-domain-containing protein [Laetiporus sulphureus 93-53]|uniref:DUF676-domain-containing protein n=1 Tax=Laetiporus sulphureus 93-53 TaxID=1314785 RepID=A0A165GBW2_9APHY|nr:DUF676-domain-containing protein [Laetiporus sulphureus 93-53]KZT10130.1 DUF676-domain-containing protein [Laetiporus sulphureus 93-53]
MSAETVHLLVLVHGMWGNPVHLAELHRTITELRGQPSSDPGPDGERLEVLLAETNREDHTYDGVDWGGERVADEVSALYIQAELHLIYEAVKRLEDAGERVTRFSITGYSLGGLVSRYTVGVLHQRKYFDKVKPVNFNTFATPHIGLPRYRNVLSSLTSYLGPKMLSRTGEQFWVVDKWSAHGRPLLEVMADPDRIFYQALCLFEDVRIYANAVNDLTVPYPTAAIEAEDIFLNHMTNGIEIELDDKYAPIIKSYSLPDPPLPPPPPPKRFTLQWLKSFQIPLPPALQFTFPFNILLYISLPVIIPLFLALVLSRLALASRASRLRLELLEKEPSSVERLAKVIARLERSVESAIDDIMDDPGNPPSSFSSPSPPRNDSPNPELGLDPKSKSHLKLGESAPQHVILTDVQLRLVRLLNTLPGLKKERAFIDPVRNAHGSIICRDPQRFEFHKLGEGVLRHWADHFVM